MEQKELAKIYDPSQVESKWYTYWEENQFFHADANSSKTPYTIMIPPPNVTGMLTMGHILNNTIQDVLIRWKKMQGFETLWMPGTDHAGIATQSKVIAALQKQGIKHFELGREKFIQRVWEWRHEYGGIILKQLRKLGASCDWDRECFTMDDNLSTAVRRVFVDLYNKGLIYRGRRLINWSPAANTALADEEVVYSDENGHFWHIAYPLSDGSGEIVVATTRPETMLGDSAVAVHPQDARYAHLIGKTVRLPLMNRDIPIIADEHADPEKGSGAVKITPAHDANDFAVGLRHGLQQISVIGPDARMTADAGVYAGLDRFAARDRILADLQKNGLLRQVEDKIIPVPRCYRTHDVIEPLLSDQWFVKMEPLAQPAIQVVREGKIRFHPKHWEETYFHWMENIHDWCISRQIWWGHRIPAWYCEKGHVTIAIADPDRCQTCNSTDLRQDEDVLDTWFSSWLWPFSTLGWPQQTRELDYFYPTDTLVTGPDIIFFWVARMIMASLEFTGKIPFKDVYFNGMIRDKDNRKMSKSLGNSPDPLWLIDGADSATTIKTFGESNESYSHGVPAYGADAIRLTMVYLTPLGGDIRFDHQMVEMGQKFCNKLWNAARFVLMNHGEEELPPFEQVQRDQLEHADRWILSRLHRTIEVVDEANTAFRFNDAVHAIYDFVWSEYCDWYLEMVKMRLYDAQDAQARQNARSVAVAVLDQIVRLLHPYMPFITEEIWQALPAAVRRSSSGVPTIMKEAYPQADRRYRAPEAEKEMELVQQTITALRTLRSEMNVPPAKTAALILRTTDDRKKSVLLNHAATIQRLARIETIETSAGKPELSASAVVQGIELYLPLADLIDIEVEKNRLTKEIERLSGLLAGLVKKLENESFLSRAPQAVVENERQKQRDFQENLVKLRANLSRLAGN
ncbi:MAG TPA: valine--tRNA ligase [bacterium]|mgnify:CR=1 FL=1|nr:valine--tRNA ligase [bacterium]HPG45531.1 valine--tRNA ligase [bacterium]HPM97690.1 valine--tRNA ligase [bacterium]